MSEHQSHVTKDHDEIQRWAEARGAVPASVEGTEADSQPGVLRFDFPGHGEKRKLRQIGWEEFFDKFDRADLSFLYQEQTSGGGTSRFFKFIHETGAQAQGPGRRESGDRSGRKQPRKKGGRDRG
jgi:hypothetical protein